MARKNPEDTPMPPESVSTGDSSDPADSSKSSVAPPSEDTPPAHALELASTEPSGFPIVAIGASAGGLESLQAFFKSCPSDMGVAFVIVQHLAPNRTTVMDSLLSKCTDMTVVKITDGMTIEPDTVYLNLPDKDLTIVGGTLCLIDREQSAAAHAPIDVFFRALADDQQKNAVCMVFSGTGSDGSLGLRAVKEAGGLVIAQEPSQARHKAMPTNAIATGLVDFVLTVEQIPERILAYKSHSYLRSDPPEIPSSQEDDLALKKVIAIVRTVTGRDLSQYKPNTLLRRTQRRMALHQIEDIADYVRYLNENPTEAGRLFEDTLITVTSFFRDPQAFDVLAGEIKDIVRRKPSDGSLRVWVAACGSGEEAYSIAVLIVEAMRDIGKHLDVQIFATDLSAAAISKARAGKYPASIALDISPQRLSEHFTKTHESYRVRKHIREMIVFSVHDLTKDPPFSRIDLISCRNVLIYMTAQLQRKVLQLLHFVLNENACLFLGSSETVGSFAEYFSTINSKWKLFKRISTPFGGRPPLPTIGGVNHSAELAAMIPDAPAGNAADISNVAEKMLLGDYAPACVMVDDRYEIVYTRGLTDPFITLPQGEPSLNILKMVRPGIRDKLIKMLHEAFASREPVKLPELRIEHRDRVITVDLVVKRIPVSLAGNRNLAIITFEANRSADDADPASRSEDEKEDPRVTELELELASTRESLQTMLEELETNNEELKSTNEELQSTNEELQSTNEELETAREELQSANEELETSNSELQSRIDETSQANADLINLLGNAEIGVLFLDNNLRIKRFTESITCFFNLIETDIGRHMADIAPKIAYSTLCRDAQEVLRNLTRVEAEVQAPDRRWISICISPYRTLENVIDGVTVVFRNIDLEVTSAGQMRHLKAVVADSNDAITVLDLDGRIRIWNAAAQAIYGYSEAEALDMNISIIVPDDEQAAWSRIMNEVSDGRSIRRMAVRRKTREGAVIDVLLTATALTNQAGKVVAVATTEHDATGTPSDRQTDS